MLVDQKKLDLYVENNYNVLFEGERGVGKTTIIFNTFEKSGYRVKYFSAPTMDPWTDLVGVPTTVTRSDGTEVLRLVPPEEFADDKYDVIFIDELNRAPKKVMNALMELMQFKTINGKKYNIKMIWAAINPHTEDEEYHVEPLDPAVKDRFQIHIKIPYMVDVDYFKKNFGQVGEIFCNWWQNQPTEVQKEISPRRLSDTAKFYIIGGDVEDMITVGNINKLKDDLKSSNQLITLEKDFKQKTISSSKGVLNKNYSVMVANYFKSSPEVFEFFLPHLDKEWLSKEFLSKNKIHDYLMKIGNSKNDNKDIAAEIIKEVVSINPGSNPFVKKNFDKFKDFMPEDVREIYEQKVAASSSLTSNTLVSENNHERNFVALINEKNLFNKSGKLSGSDIKIFNWSNMSAVAAKGILAVKNGHITIDRCKEQIAERIGIVFALITAEKSDNDSIQRTFDSLMSPTNSSYIWGKKDIDSQLSDMGSMIFNVMEKYKGLTSEEIKETYSEITEKPKKIKTKLPRKLTPAPIEDEDDSSIANYDGETYNEEMPTDEYGSYSSNRINKKKARRF